MGTKYPGVPDQLTEEQARKRLKIISDRLQEAYTLLCGEEWRDLERDLPLRAARAEACKKAREGYAINELARKRLAELAEPGGEPN